MSALRDLFASTYWYRVTIVTLVVGVPICIFSGAGAWALTTLSIVQTIFTVMYVIRNVAPLLGQEPFAAFRGTVWRFYIFVTSAVTFGAILVGLYALLFVAMGPGTSLFMAVNTPILEKVILEFGLFLLIAVPFSVLPFAFYLLVAPLALIWRRLRPEQSLTALVSTINQ